MTVHPFSPAGRTAALKRLAEETFDLLVIGGGITGAGLARDAALRGLSVALVEKEDFGSGTSGRSSKLVHGGLRYLVHGEVRLVRESARERAVLRRIAPTSSTPCPSSFPSSTATAPCSTARAFRYMTGSPERRLPSSTAWWTRRPCATGRRGSGSR